MSFQFMLQQKLILGNLVMIQEFLHIQIVKWYKHESGS